MPESTHFPSTTDIHVRLTLPAQAPALETIDAIRRFAELVNGRFEYVFVPELGHGRFDIRTLELPPLPHRAGRQGLPS
jgi:hypothetical protein